MSLRIVIVCAICLMMLSIASAESVSLPLKSVKKPSADLVSSSGVALDVGQAAALAAQGTDLSKLNPLENKMWQDRIYPAVEEAPGSYPRAQTGVKFLSEEAAPYFTYMSRVQSLENPNLFYRLSLSRYTHTTLMRAALLRKLGYYIPSPKYYRNLRLFFNSEDEKKEFLSKAQEAMTSDFESRGWVIEDNKQNHSIVFSDAVLEPAVNEYFDIHWGYAPDPNNPDHLPMVQRFSRYRAYRALIMPFALVDVPESINRYSAKLGSVLSGHVVITHPSAESFSACTYEDARWLTRRLAQLRYSDFQEIVKAGAFPPELESLVLAKLMHRANNALELFNLKGAASWPLPSLDITTSSGLVKNGKVTKEFVPGYPQRFSHGDRQSPFQDGDLGRYLGIRSKSAVIGTVLNHINEKLDLLKVSDLYANRREEITDRIYQHIKEKPFEPLYQKVEAWGGPVGGLNLAATRHVTTGTYFGSSAAIQLVDNMSVGGRLGYFMALDGVPDVIPVGGANIQVMRDYTHVRPLLSIQEGTKVPWQNLLVPRFMSNLSKVLSKKELVTSEDGKTQRQPLDAFLSELREGEVFTITDSVALSVYGQLSSSLDVLMGISPLNYVNSVTVGGDASRVILRQTSFMRTRDGIQVYVRSQGAKALGLSLDVNFFINVVRARASTTWTELNTDAFVISYNPELAEYIDTDRANEKVVQDFIKTRDNLKPALRALFKENDPELLYTHFSHKKFEIDHDLKTKELRSKFLAMRVSSFNEDHLLKIRYPRSLEAPDLNPKDEEVTLFSNKRGELKGRDLLGFAMDWIEGILNRWWPKGRADLARNDDPNPANTPYGKAYWRMITTEADLTTNGKQYPSISMIQHVWGGWHLNRKKFLKLIDEVQGELKGSPVSSYRLIEPEAFANVTAVDFYRISANLSILPGGLDKIRDLILQPDADGKPVKRARFIGAIFQKLSQKMGRKARANDQEMFDDMMRVMGNGNFERGKSRYKQICEEYHEDRQKERTMQNNGGAWVNGTYFDCMIPWMSKLLGYSANYPKDKKSQTQWMTNVLYVLEAEIPLPQLLKFLGEENYVFFVRINGFRTGDEDGDLEYFSNTLGDPKKNVEYANGLINMFATKTGISPIELDRSLGSFR
ncbi:hypothetical protein QJS83_07820 [Bdellovibrio sp. 22V]|uniref:hypothetical protein n=1 Tax=Bdellovibrio sp. 22V TaxID=3044166 RepID=UPI0025439CC3|nr:hypothetical protein [Bdellovibrio sp. 22V]WII73782.1 hypothetical protein QJS83_07820 [Bdellovibrio sp. 22V]